MFLSSLSIKSSFLPINTSTLNLWFPSESHKRKLRIGAKACLELFDDFKISTSPFKKRIWIIQISLQSHSLLQLEVRKTGKYFKSTSLVLYETCGTCRSVLLYMQTWIKQSLQANLNPCDWRRRENMKIFWTLEEIQIDMWLQVLELA